MTFLPASRVEGKRKLLRAISAVVAVVATVPCHAAAPPPATTPTDGVPAPVPVFKQPARLWEDLQLPGLPNFLVSASTDKAVRFAVPLETGEIYIYQWRTDAHATTKWVLVLPQKPAANGKPAETIVPLCAALKTNIPIAPNTPQATLLAVSCSDGNVYVYQVSDADRETTTKPWLVLPVREWAERKDEVFPVAFIPTRGGGGQRIEIASGMGDRLRYYALPEVKPVATKPGEIKYSRRLSLEPDTFKPTALDIWTDNTSALTVCGSQDKNLVIFSQDEKLHSISVSPHKKAIRYLKISPGGKQFVSLSSDAAVLWDVSQGLDKATPQPLADEKDALCAVFAPAQPGAKEHDLLLIGHSDGRITIHDLHDPNQIKSYTWSLIGKTKSGYREIYGLVVTPLKAVPKQGPTDNAPVITALGVAGTDQSFRLYDLKAVLDAVMGANPAPVAPTPPPVAAPKKETKPPVVTKPATTIKPTDLVKPTDPAKHSDPVKPIDPAPPKPTDPAKTATPAKPVEPAKPATPPAPPKGVTP